MFTYETADQKEVRRFRIAQFNGRPATTATRAPKRLTRSSDSSVRSCPVAA